MKTILLCFLNFILLSLPIAGQNFGQSGWCQSDHNVNVSSWNAAIKNMKDAVFMVKIPFKENSSGNVKYFQCTGTLINQNVNQNSLRQIFVLAKHCVEKSHHTLLENDPTYPWLFYFNFQSPNGDNESVPNFSNINNSNRDGRRYRFQSGVKLIRNVTICDFTMGEILDTIPPHYNVYYQGWSASLLQGLSLPNYCLHHPKGDIKKWASSHFTRTYTDYTCHTVTEVIDITYQLLIGWWSGSTINTTQVCNYVELPFWLIPVWTSGTTENGSSGSGLLNYQQRLIGVLTGGPSGEDTWSWPGCDGPGLDYFGKLSTAVIQSSEIKRILEPNDFWALNSDGRRINCYENLLNLNGLYYPAKDYQPENKIKLQAANEVTTLAAGNTIYGPIQYTLNILPGADFEFVANKAIRLRPGFRVSSEASFSAKIGNCSVPSGSRLAVNESGHYPKFRIGALNTKTTFEKSILFELTPNPSNGIFEVRVSLPKLINGLTIQVFSTDGKVVFSKLINDVSVFQSQIDLSNLPDGVYMMQLSGTSVNVNRRLVVVH